MAASADRPAAERHVPVLLDRCVELLAPALVPADGVPPVLVDATLGMGGHTEAFLDRVPGLVVVGLDRDPQALALAGERLGRFGERFVPVHTVYDRIDEVVLEELGRPVQAVLMDLGVSSLQLDEVERGFSYAHDAPLDMRMDASGGITAAEVLNTYPESDITRVLREYGEERWAARIAQRRPLAADR